MAPLYRALRLWRCSGDKKYKHTGEASLDAFIGTLFSGNVPEILNTDAGKKLLRSLLNMTRQVTFLKDSFIARTRIGLRAGLSMITFLNGSAHESEDATMIEYLLGAAMSGRRAFRTRHGLHWGV